MPQFDQLVLRLLSQVRSAVEAEAQLLADSYFEAAADEQNNRARLLSTVTVSVAVTEESVTRRTVTVCSPNLVVSKPSNVYSSGSSTRVLPLVSVAVTVTSLCASVCPLAIVASGPLAAMDSTAAVCEPNAVPLKATVNAPALLFDVAKAPASSPVTSAPVSVTVATSCHSSFAEARQ